MPRAPDPAAGAGRRVADLGELGVLARIAARVAAARIPAGEARVVAGIGDDTAVLRPTEGRLTLLTTDALVEDVHFTRATSTAADVGWKALAINVSDIGAMGGMPTHAVISLMAPDALDAEWVDGLYDGILEMAAHAGAGVVGGNLTQAPSVIVDVALLGEVEPERLIRRDGAREGDLLVVTGTLGRAAAGLVALARPGLAADAEMVARAVAAQRRPQPRLAAGRALAGTGVVRAMIDLSDGLMLDLWRMCAASGVGAAVDAGALPIDPCVAAVAEAAGRSALDLAASGGEDYELLFAVAPSDADRAIAAVQGETGLPVAIIGRVRPAADSETVTVDGVPRPLDRGGWTHFGRSERT